MPYCTICGKETGTLEAHNRCADCASLNHYSQPEVIISDEDQKVGHQRKIRVLVRKLSLTTVLLVLIIVGIVALVNYTNDTGPARELKRQTKSGEVEATQKSEMSDKDGEISQDRSSDNTLTVETIEGFVFVPGGTFTMGDTHGIGGNDEYPTQNVTLNSFYIGKYEVTQTEWQTVMRYNPAQKGTDNRGYGSEHPVYYVSWYSAIKYCNLRSIFAGLTPCYTIKGSTVPADWGSVPSSMDSIEGLTRTSWDAAICNWNANGYRLPTEAEWEYAARGGASMPDFVFSGSDNLDYVGWYPRISGGNAQPIGMKSCNRLDIYDMSGNVWEWCWDWYGAYSGKSQVNPTGPMKGTSRIYRGGSCDYPPSNCRVSYRSQRADPSWGGNPLCGIRLCRSAK